MLRPRASGPASGLYYRGAYAALDFASRIYELDDASYTAGGLTTVPGFTFTGASLRTMFDSTGAMTYGPNNLLLWSQEFDNVVWTKAGSTITANAVVAPDGTLTADKLAEDTGTSQHRAFNLNAVTVSTTETVAYSVYAKAAGRNFLFLTDNNISGAYFNLTTGAATNLSAGVAASSTDAGNGWWRCCIARVPTTSSGRLIAGAATAAGTNSYTGDGTSGIYLWGAQLEAVTYRTTPAAYMPTTSAAYYGPRLVYDPVTLASLGILVEEARTNSCLYSQALDNVAWLKMSGVASVTPNATTSPDGTQNADLVTEDSGSTYKAMYQSVPLGAGTYTGSVYFKAGTGSTRYMRLVISSSSVNYGYITANMSTGAITQVATANGTASAASGSIGSVGNGWYRLILTVTLAASMDFIFFEPYDTGTPAAGSDYGRLTYTGNGSTWSLWQAQVELGTGASSAIVTTSAAVTRAADVPIETTGLTYPLTVVAEFIRNWDAGVEQVVCQVDAGSDAQRAYASIDSSDLFAGTTSGSGASTVAGATVAGTAYKGAVRVATNDVQTARGGTLGTADTSATNPTDPTRLVIGQASSAASLLNGTISRIRIYNRALSDAQLQALTA